MNRSSPDLHRPANSHARLRVGIYVDFSDGWLGGLNYFKNLVNTVQALPGRPIEFVVLTGLQGDETLLEQWREIEIARSPIFDRFSARWLLRKLTQKYFLSDPLLDRFLAVHSIDVLSHSGYVGAGSNVACIGWIPDFQHLHLPDVFRRWDIVRRNAEIQRIVKASCSVIVSSHAAEQDLLSIAPEAHAKVEVMRFVGEASDLLQIAPLEDLQSRYGFTGSFAFLPNQYWRHKNHLAVIRAVAALKREGRNVLVLSTGKTDDFRNPDFFKSVEAEMDQLDVREEYRVLGVIPYADVASLMHHCRFVVNPSLFEGWSTTVEEAKARDKHIVLSDIPVHREQAPASADFFTPLDHHQLSRVLWARWEELRDQARGNGPDPLAVQREHAGKRLAFAENYLAIVRRALDRKAA